MFYWVKTSSKHALQSHIQQGFNPLKFLYTASFGIMVLPNGRSPEYSSISSSNEVYFLKADPSETCFQISEAI